MGIVSFYQAMKFERCMQSILELIKKKIITNSIIGNCLVKNISVILIEVKKPGNFAYHSHFKTSR